MTLPGQVGMTSYPPRVKVGEGNPESLKYGKLWAMASYRQFAPGETLATDFLRVAQPKRGAEVIDFGCGTGRGSLMLSLLGGLKVTMVDFVRNCLDPEIREALTTQPHALRFLKHDLEQPLSLTAEYGYCTDVMEHIPPDSIDAVLQNILRSAEHVFFSIATGPDVCGRLIGEALHLSVHPFEWWIKKLQDHKYRVHWSEEREGVCLFYGTVWENANVLSDRTALNVSDSEILEHVKANIGGGWMQVSPHATNDLEAMILGGGPSLAEYERDIRQKRADGVKLITLNGAYNWCLERDLTPSATVVVDAREFNKRFTHPVVDKCKYLIASQCHPAVLEGLPKDRTYLWHSASESLRDVLNAAYPVWFGIPGGCTALLRAIPLFRMLGYRKFHLYGCDSCLQLQHDGNFTGDQSRDRALPPMHHAYAQPENDSPTIVPVKVTGGRIFQCYPWMAAQASEFIDLIRALGNEVDLAVYGNGLLAHILHTGASLDMED